MLFTGDAYIFAVFLILFIHWEKHGNEHSKFSGFFLCWTNIPKPDDNKNMAVDYVSLRGILISYAVRYNKTLIDWLCGY
jgi:hypothetical protein